MYTRLIYPICFVLALSLVCNVQAQDAIWTDAKGDHDWFTPENWSEFPTDAHWAKIRNGLPGPTIAAEGAIARRVHVGYSEGGALTVDGGILLITADDLRLGKNGGSGTLNMISGSISVARDLDVGGGEPGIVNMTGGTITVSRDLEMPDEAGSTAEVNLNGGTISLGDDLSMGEGGALDITAGMLIIDGNDVSMIQGYIDNGWITAYDGDGTVQLDYDVTNPGKTTIKGVHKLKPNPIDGGLVVPGSLELSWILPDPCVPGEAVLVDVYFTDNWEALYSFTDPEAIRIASMQNVTSVAVQAQPKTRYYWAVDTYVGDPNDPIFGPIFSFLADNQAPQADAGPDLLTWLDNGSVDAALAGTVTDTDPTTTVWTVVSQPEDPNSPDAVIADAAALNTIVTLSAPGEYVLKFQADDGEYQGEDTMTINVYSDSCEAAKSLPGYEPIPGDINEDCVVDELDQAIMMENWLKCNALDCTDPDHIHGE